MPTLQQRAATGAAWLDATMPDWFRKIDLNTLDISTNRCCVIGQLFGSFNECVPGGQETVLSRGLNIDYAAHSKIAMRHKTKAFRNLTEAWKREIESRLAA